MTTVPVSKAPIKEAILLKNTSVQNAAGYAETALQLLAFLLPHVSVTSVGAESFYTITITTGNDGKRLR